MQKWCAGLIFFAPIQHGFQRNGNKFFHFFCTSARPLRNDDDLRIGYIGKGFNRRFFIAPDAHDYQYRRHKKHKIAVTQGKMYDVLDKLIHKYWLGNVCKQLVQVLPASFFFKRIEKQYLVFSNQQLAFFDAG